ncbi:transporter, partial [Vibrio makurazakiensis]
MAAQMVENFHFIRPLWLLITLPFIGLLYLNWRAQTKKTKWLNHIPKHLFNALRVGQALWKNHLPIKLLSVIGITAIVILSGPSWYRQASPFGEDQSPLVVVLDVSE